MQIDLNSEKHRRWKKVFNLFKLYLLNDTLQNKSLLKSAFDKLPLDERLICEMVAYKDPVIKLMASDREFRFSKEERIHMLKDYFEDEWDEVNLKY